MSYVPISFNYDPAQQGYDTNTWRTISGNPSILSGRLVLDVGAGQGTAIHNADFLKGEVSFNINIPVAPGVNASRYFGISTGRNEEYIRFAINDDLTCQVANNGTTAESDAIAWNANWTGANIIYTIRWESGTAKFFIDGTQVYAVSSAAIPYGTLSLYLSDESGSAMSVGLIHVKGTQSYILNPKTTDTTSPGGGLLSMSESLTVSENVALTVA